MWGDSKRTEENLEANTQKLRNITQSNIESKNWGKFSSQKTFGIKAGIAGSLF